jgi:hypothetical protein
MDCRTEIRTSGYSSNFHHIYSTYTYKNDNWCSTKVIRSPASIGTIDYFDGNLITFYYSIYKILNFKLEIRWVTNSNLQTSERQTYCFATEIIFRV